MKAVVDASVVAEVLLRSGRARAVEARMERGQVELCAPYLIDIEVCSAVQRHLGRGHMDLQHARQTLDVFRSLPIERYPHLHLIDRIVALRHNISAYDAAYVALAEVLDAPLLTLDARLAAAPGHDARIELV